MLTDNSGSAEFEYNDFIEDTDQEFFNEALQKIKNGIDPFDEDTLAWPVDIDDSLGDIEMYDDDDCEDDDCDDWDEDEFGDWDEEWEEECEDDECDEWEWECEDDDCEDDDWGDLDSLTDEELAERLDEIIEELKSMGFDL